MLWLSAVSGCSTTPARTDAGQSNAELEALYHARVDSARMRFTEADVHFVHGMIAHHAQALVMAGLTATHTSTPALHTLSGRVINAQKDEIALMQQWLRDRRLPAADAAHHHDMRMPGMLTPEQMRELEQARGVAFDRLFLKYMIQHHKGAVTMVQQLFATNGAAQEQQIFKLATDVQVDQTTEIARMELMLAAINN